MLTIVLGLWPPKPRKPQNGVLGTPAAKPSTVTALNVVRLLTAFGFYVSVHVDKKDTEIKYRGLYHTLVGNLCISHLPVTGCAARRLRIISGQSGLGVPEDEVT